MKNLIYITKRTKMEKVRLNLLKFFSFVLLVFVIQTGYSTNIDKNGFENSLDATIACNDTVLITMDIDCVTEVLPDQLLEGNYPDMTIFVVDILDQNNVSIGNIVDSDHVGLTLNAEVLDTTTGNRCWTRIQIRDKYPPQLECNTMFTTCYKYPIPGEFTPHNYRFAFNPNTDIPDGDTLTIPLEVGSIPGASIVDIDVQLNISHENDIDLAAFLVSPTNDTVVLFEQLTCGNEDFEVKFDDNAEKTAADLTAGCSPNACCPDDPAIKGTYQAKGNLSDFNGENPVGTWQLVVIDKNAGNLGVVDYVAILLKQNGGYVNFPIPNTSSTPINIGENKYKVVSGFDACGEVVISYVDSLEELDCSTNYTGLLKRKWLAEDESGNTSTCTQYIYIIRTGTSFLTFPPDYDNIDLPALSCNNPNAYTGVPGTELCGMVTVTHTDDTINICSGTIKIIRHWRVSEMCSSEVIDHDQIIAIMDTEGPVLSYVSDFSLPADGLECSTDIFLALPNIEFDCSDNALITFEVGYQKLDALGNPETSHLLTDNIEKLGNGTYVLRDAEIGTYRFTYTATDDCDNHSSTTNEVTIYDDSPPVAVCDQHTVVTIGTDGTARTDAIVYDDGSHDNCSEVTFKVSRNGSYFTDYISFGCNDVNTTQMVTLQVTDASHHTNTCMVEISIVDKIPPIIVCPKNILIKCTDDYTNLELTGIAEGFDNCAIDTLGYSDNVTINQCNTGYVIRTWTTTDYHGHFATCTQTITIRDNKKFNGDYDIIWPTNKIFTDCVENFDTSITGTVRYRNEDFCSMVAARYEDELFNVVEGSCLKILRHWEVIDWCNFDQDPEGSTWTHTQTIVLENNVAPEFDENCARRDFCTYGECKGLVEYTKTASDDCTLTENLNWSYQIDLNNDGSWDVGPINSNSISRIFNNGTHRVAWSVEDGCGNISTCEEIWNVSDCKNPTPLCITRTAIAIMNHVGMVTVCAEDFNLGDNCDDCPSGSYDNCTPREDLLYSFSSNTNDTCQTFTCEDIPDGKQQIITLDMWVTDEAGNQDFCTVYLSLQDNEADACTDTLDASLVGGFVYDPRYSALENVDFKLESTEGFEYHNTSGTNGKYGFDNILEDKNYTLSANMETSYLIGVTTLDLVLIQKHILGISDFNKPYQYIAADVNHSKTITASDILLIRKVILGIKDDFGANSKPWAFVEDGDDIRNNFNILNNWKSTKNIDKTMFGQNFNWVGIKMGDINGNSTQDLENRNSKNTILVSNDLTYNENEEVRAEFKYAEMSSLAGGQFTLSFDSDKLEFVDIITNSKLISDNSFGLTNIDKGMITTSWIKPQNIEQSDDELFTVLFKAKTSGNLSEAISITSDITKSEAYNTEYETMGIELQFRNKVDNSSVYKLYQNSPNPFKNETTILFDLPKSQVATIKFTDVTGKVIKTIKKDFNKGSNSVIVSFENLTPGVIYYKLETNEFTQTKKMINIR